MDVEEKEAPSCDFRVGLFFWLLQGSEEGERQVEEGQAEGRLSGPIFSPTHDT